MDSQASETFVAAAREEILAGPPPRRLSVNAAEAWQSKSVRKKFLALWRGFFPDRVLMASMYPVAADSPRVYWYYLVRVTNLFRRYWRTLWALATRDERMSAAPLRATILSEALGRRVRP